MRPFERQWRALTETMQVALDQGDISVLIDRAAKLLADVFAAQGVAIFELSADRRSLQLVGGTGVVRVEPGARPVPAGVCRPLYEALSGDSCLSFDLRALEPALAVRLPEGRGVTIPIGSRLQRAGVIAVLKDQRTECCSETETSFLESVAYILASAWERQRTDAVLALRNRALEALEQGIMITDAQRIGEPLIYVNAAFEVLTGYRREQAAGKNPRFLQGADTDASTVRDLRDARQAGRPFRTTILNYRRDGTSFWNDLAVSAIRDDSGRVTHNVGVMSDATERLQLEAQFRQAQKMEAVGHLTGGIAHDFNNILAVILGNAEIILDDVPHGEMRRLIEQVIGSAERGALLTQRLLAFGRRQALQPEPVALSPLIVSLIDLLTRSLGETIDIVVKAGAQTGRALVDRTLLESALINLALNARDAMPEGGILTITTGDREAAANLLPPELADKDFLCVSVTDTGSGMTPDVLSKVFEPFFTTKDVGKGSGLGLAMVYGFVQQSGGHVFIDSEIGRGTTVNLFLPMAVDAPERLSPPTPRTALPTGTERILLVEDEADVRSFVSRLLCRLGYTVIEAEDAGTALELLANNPVDLLFSDLILPGGKNGLRLLEEAREMQPGLRVLLTTGYTEEYERLSEGAPARILRKPYRQAELASTLRDVLCAA